uniref:Uncharacterized protein n=1 Tax=Arundo donax TaxID=35708 RepID=A0A0A8YY16_ARUDO
MDHLQPMWEGKNILLLVLYDQVLNCFSCQKKVCPKVRINKISLTQLQKSLLVKPRPQANCAVTNQHQLYD